MTVKTFEKTYQVDCAYPNGEKGIGLLSEVEESLVIAVGYSESSGSGFGMRDHQYARNTEKDAEELSKKVIEVFTKAGIKNINVEGENNAYVNVVELHDECGTQHDEDERCPLCQKCKGLHEEDEACEP